MQDYNAIIVFTIYLLAMDTCGHCISTTAMLISNWGVTESMYSCTLEYHVIRHMYYSYC